MKEKVVNGRWAIWTTDVIADWDGGTGDYSARRGWEFERMESLQQRLKYGDVFFDVGVEHGWLSTIIGREFVGAENMVLIEPSPEFWVNIRKHWQYNGLNEPLGCFEGFFSNESDDVTDVSDDWPASANLGHQEVPSMSYKSMHVEHGIPIATITLDDYISASEHMPDAINIDVEGAELLVIEGAQRALKVRHPLVWISIHPGMLRRDFNSDPDDLHYLMERLGYKGTHLGTDHEEHWLFE